jgi:uncharacterized protein YjbI with pentapeptide repeats
MESDGRQAALAALAAGHRLWLESDGAQGARLDSPGADFSGLDLAGLDLRHAVLPDANLAYADCRGTDFSGCDLNGADLRQASCVGAAFCDANLRASSLEATRFIEADLSGADVSDANLTATDFSDAVLRGANLAGSCCFESVFQGADLSDASLRFAAIWRTGVCVATLRGTDLTGANMEGSSQFQSAVSLLETASLYRVTHLAVTSLFDYAELTEAQRARLEALLHTPPPGA